MVEPLDTTDRVPTPAEYVAWIRAANKRPAEQLFEDHWITAMLDEYALIVQRHTRAKIDADTLAAANALDDDLFALATRVNRAAQAVRDALRKCRAE